MSLGDANGVKTELAALLGGPDFTAALAAVVSENADGYVPPLPNAIFTEEVLTKQLFPMAELIAFRESFSELNTMVKQIDVELGIRWTMVARDERTVTRNLETYVKATVDLLFGTNLRRMQSGPVIIREVDYGPMVPAIDQPFLKSAIVVIMVPIWRA